MTGRRRLILAGACLIAIVGSAGALAQSAEETVARGRLESGRNFARQGNYEEALADFRAVAESHATTSVADDALLEIARYYFDIAGDMDQAEAAVQAIITSYPTSDSAPAAFVMAGRLAMGRGRDAEHLNAALAHFERLVTVFPTSTAVPAALALAGEAHYYAGRLDEALASLSRVTAEYPADPAAAEAYLFSGQVLLAMSDPILAMEELQQVRNRWPDLPAADAALARITLLHRLYVRGANGAAYVPVPETVGPARLENVRAVVATAAGAVYAVSERGVAIVTPADADPPPPVGEPSGGLVDAVGRLVVVDGRAVLHPTGGTPLTFFATQPNGEIEPLDNIEAAAQLTSGSWLIMDGDARSIFEFAADGTFLGPFAAGRVRRLAISAAGVVAGIERNRRSVLVFDDTGRPLGQIQLRGETYDLRDAEDLAFDALGHLYVLVEDRIGVFSPFPPSGGGAAVSAGAGYRLLTVYAVPDGAPGRFDRARAFALDASGTAFLYDDRAHRILVYR